MSGSLIILLVLSIALDFLDELGPFCICFYGSTRMQQGRDFILSRENSKYPFFFCVNVVIGLISLPFVKRLTL